MERLSSLIIALIGLNSGVLLAYDPIADGLTLPAAIYQNEGNEIIAAARDFDGDLSDVKFEYDGPSTGTNWIQIGQDVPVVGDEDTAQTTWTPTETGAHKVRYTVTDESGNTDFWVSSSLTVVSGSPEVVSVTLPATVFAEKDNTISATVKDPSGNLDEVQFQYDGPAAGTSWMDIGSDSVSGSSDTAEFNTWRPTKVGEFKIQATVTDESDNTDSEESTSFTVISPQPVPQTITLPATAEKGKSITITATASDLDGNLKEMVFYYAFDYKTGDSWTRLNSNPIAVSGSSGTAKDIWTPAQVGTASFHTTVEDHDGYRHDSALGGPVWVVGTVEVKARPEVESITVPALVCRNESNTLSAVVTDEDGDLDEVQFQYQGPTGNGWNNIGSVSVSGSRATPSISWTPTRIGTHKIRVTVTDETNKTDTDTSTSFTVKAAPEVGSITVPNLVCRNESSTLSVVVTDDDGDLDEVQFQYQGPTGTSWNNIGSAVSVSGSRATPSVSWTPTEIGSHKIKVTVTDGTNKTGTGTSTNFTVKAAPEVDSVTVPALVCRNESSTLSAVVTDDDGDLDNVLFQYDGPSSGTTWEDIGSVSVTGSSDTAEISWTPSQIGSHKIRVTVTDDTDKTDTDTSSSFTVKAAPEVSSITVPSMVCRNESNTLSAVVTDDDGDLDNVQFQYDGPAAGTNWVDIGSVSVSGSRATPSISWTPSQIGTHKIKVIVTDETDKTDTSTSSSFTVKAAPGVAYILVPPTVYYNEANTILALVSDADGDLDNVLFQYDGPAAGTSWEDIGSVSVSGPSDTAEISWTPTQLGSHKIKVTVTDATDKTGNLESVSFEVVAAPRVVHITIPRTVYNNQANTISAGVADDDGDLNEVEFEYDGPASGTTWEDIGTVEVSGSSDTASISWTPTQTGSHKIRVTVSDDTTSTRDDTRTTGSFEVVEPPTPPRVGSITVPSRVYHNQANTLSARVTDVNGDLDEALFQYDGPAPGTIWEDIGSVSVYGSSDTATINWTPTLLGTYKIRVTATDEDNNTDTRSSNSFTVECSPVLSN